MKRVAIYTRLSPTKDKSDTENQYRDLVRYAEAQGWEIVKHYQDIWVTGSMKGVSRPKFSEMMEDARKRKFDLVLFWSLDRLSREGALETLQYFNTLTSYGVDYKSYQEQYLDSCGVFKDAVISIMACVAKQEKIRLIERTLAGIETARLRGKKIGRPPTKVDVKVLRKMRDEGKTFKQIATEYSYKDRKGKARSISEATAYRLLKGYGKCQIEGSRIIREIEASVDLTQ